LSSSNTFLAGIHQKSTPDYLEAIVVGKGMLSLPASFIKTAAAFSPASPGHPSTGTR
jgi:hypothetical protein